MKKNLPVTQVEKPFPAKLRLVSKTDLKGIITYANDAFVEMSGFTREELMGKNHNIVRHPDMPPQAFKWLWDTLKEGHPWRGIVKNRSKSGDHYWVKALVVPIKEGEKVTGYMSVRNEPTRAEIEAADALYKELNRTNAAIGSSFDKYRFKNLKLRTKLQLIIQSMLLVVLTASQFWIYQNFEDKTLKNAQTLAEQVANETIDSANMLMVTGAISVPENRRLLIKKLTSSGHVKSVQLVRAQQVVNQFGPGLPEEHISDPLQQQTIDNKLPHYELTKDADGSPIFRAITPYIVSHDFHGTDCLGCHTVEVGSVNGASDIKIDLSADFATLHDMQLKLTIGQVLLQVFLFFFIGRIVTVFIKRPLDQSMKQFERIIQGELGADIDISGRDEMGELFGSIQTMQAHIQVMLDEMGLAARVIEERCQSLNQQVVLVADHSLEQLDHVQHIASTMEQLSQSVAEVANSAQESSSYAVRTQQVIDSNNDRMQENMETTSHVVDAVQSSSKTITELKDAILKIGDIAKVIKEIADQTNLLALNAAIEAARAGEQGRGFAVVADEVRKLAERTTSSTGDISNMINNIHDVTQAAVRSMDMAVQEVGTGIELTRATADGLQEIKQASGQVTDMSRQIASASREQSLSSEEVARNLEQVTQLVESNTRIAEEAKLAANELTRTAAELQAMVAHFEVKSH
jgi:PAS domain S-box-containing protein